MRRSFAPTSRNGSLYALAVSRLHQLFPGMVVGKKKPLAKKLAKNL
jgi:hypothetical protein